MDMTHQTPCISIIIPVYNAARVLPRCLDSILDQTFPSFEIIAINDGSTDGSMHILNEYAQAYPHVLHVFNRTNHGAAASRNFGIDQASGNYIAFVDNDDWLDPDYLDRLYRSAVASNAEIVLSGYRRPDESGNIVKTCTISPDTEWANYAVEAAWAKLYKRSFVLSNNLSFLEANISEDLAFTLPAIQAASTIVALDYCGYNWYVNTESVSNTLQRSSADLEFEIAMDEIKARLYTHSDARSNDCITYFFVRHVIWFLIWTSAGDDEATLRKNCTHYINWLDSNFPYWKDNSIGTPIHPTGDELATRCIVNLFMRHPNFALNLILLYKRATAVRAKLTNVRIL